MTLATEAVVTRFADSLRAFVARRVGPEAVDDVVQDVLLRIHRGLPGREAPDAGDEDRRLAAWVYAIARNTVVDHFRARRAHVALETDPAAEVDPVNDDMALEVSAWLRPMIEQLEPIHRDALERVELGGMSQRAYAEHTGLSASGARTRVQRARVALRSALERCCAIELDARNRVSDYTPRPGCCD